MSSSAFDGTSTPQDVAEVLQRLCVAASGRVMSTPDGLPMAPVEEILQRWQAVASTYDLDQLRCIYKYIEDVIISCGAPDAFDVYEVCFEALAKIGFCLHEGPAKEILFQVLEAVHEVYDVLLSCVETYEWVQPGVTGLLRLWMLQVVFACFGSTKITGRDLMMLTDNDVSGAVSLISFILRCDNAPFGMQSTAGRCLVELTTADSVFLTNCEEESYDGQSQQIAKLAAMLNRHVNALIKAIIQFDVVEASGRCICQHQMSHTRTDIAVKHFLTTIHNCLLYCSENQKKLRQHLATQSTIVQDIMIPYTHNILPALYDSPICGPSMIEWQNLKSTLQTFVVVTFNINVFRSQLRDADMIPRVCKVPGILSHISMLELLIKLAINVDFAKGQYRETVQDTLQFAFDSLLPDSKVRLQRRMTSGQSMRLPYAKSSIESVQALAFALTPPLGEEVASPEVVESRKAQRKQRWSEATNKGSKRKQMFAMQQSEAPPQADDSDDDMPPVIPADGWESQLGAADETGLPSRALCQLSGGLMHDPVATPDGFLFERAALEDWTQHSPTNPLTGAALDIADCASAIDIQSYIQGYQLQSLSACQIAPDAWDEPPPMEALAPAPAAPVTGPSLLGDLPTLAQEQQKPKRKEKSKIRIESRSVFDCPNDMCCAIDGKVMTNPLRSPSGHFFEKKTLERWMRNCGSVCPITDKPLRLEECVPDAEMKRRIVKFLRGQL